MTDHLSTASVHAGFPSAGIRRRIAAWVYDLLVAVAIIMLATAVALGVAAILTTLGWVTLADGDDHAAWLNSSPLFSIYIVAILALFFGWFWWRSGQTLGMRAWRLKVQQQNGSRLTVKQTFIRLLTCVFGLGNAWVLIDRKHRRAWHDYAAGSDIVVLSKEANQLYYWRDL